MVQKIALWLFKSQKLTITGTGAATTTVNNQTITVDVAEGTLSNNADGTVKADAAGVATTKKCCRRYLIRLSPIINIAGNYLLMAKPLLQL